MKTTFGTISRKEYKTARIAEDCRRSLSKFVSHAWSTVDSAPFINNWHISAISEHLEAVTNKQIQKLIINCPPGVAKSSVVSVMWPAWEWIDHPGEQSLFGSYDIDLALRDSTKCRAVVESEWYRETFRPEWKLAKDQNAKSYYKNTLHGNRYTFGMLAGGKTGWRGNKVCLDDPNNIKDRFNPTVLDATFQVFNDVLCTRVNDITYSSFVVIQQRMSSRDFTGRLIKETEDSRKLYSTVDESLPFEWVHLKLPMEASRPCTTVIGWTDPRKEPGELLFPSKFPKPALDYIRTRRLGEAGYQGQYQQEPVPDGGARFNKSDFLHWQDLGRGAIVLHRRGGLKEVIRLVDCFTFVSVDFAASEKTQADYTVFSTWAVTKNFDLILLDRFKDRLTEPKIVEKALEIYLDIRYSDARHSCFVVEDNGLGLPISQNMMSKGLPVLPVHINRMDKFVRSATAAIRLENGQVFFPNPSTPWYCDPENGWEVELINFPSYEHDDQVDTFSLAAEAVYEAMIFGEGDSATLTPEIKNAAQILEGKDRNPAQKEAILNMSKRFFGRRS